MTSQPHGLASIVEWSNDAIIGLTLDGRVTSWNPAAERMYGYSATTMMGEPMSRLVPSELHDAERRFIERVACGARVTSVDTSRLRADGSRLMASITLVPVFDDAGHPTALVAIERDITALRALEAQLLQAKRMEAVGRLAGGAAQEFNNINTAILGLVEFVVGELPADSTARADLDEISRQAMRASGLARQLLAFSGRQVLAAHAMSVDDTVRDMEPLLHRLAGERAWLMLDLNTRAAHVSADEAQLELVMFELVMNAADAVGERGSISISTRQRLVDDAFAPSLAGVPAGLYVEIAVRDSGVGMTDASRALAFDPFFTTKDGDGHMGMGLALVYAVVHGLGGHVTAAHAEPTGTEVCIFLPIVDGQNVPTSRSAAVPAAGGNETILMVEDEEPVRAVVTRGLRALGYTVLEAKHGEDALDVAAAHAAPIHLVISDVVMPQMDGRALFDHLRGWYPNIGFLFVSGYTRGALTEEELRSPSTQFLAKPFSMEQLVAEVRRLLDRPRERQ